MKQFSQDRRTGNVSLLRPNRAQKRATQTHGGIDAIVLIDCDQQTRCIIAWHRKKSRVQVKRQLQMLGKALQLHQPISLALRRTLPDRQATGDRKNLAHQIHGLEPNRGPGLSRDVHETCVPKISPRALWGNVVVDAERHVCAQPCYLFEQAAPVAL